MDQDLRNRALPVRNIALIATLLTITSLQTKPVRADETHLAIAVKDNPTGFEKRIRAELFSLGFEVPMVTVDPDSEPYETLESLAVEAKASAAIRVEDSTDKVEIWVADRITGKLLNRKVSVSGDSADSHAVVAFAAIDLLRASLMELDLHKKEASKEIEPVNEPPEEKVVQAEIKPLNKKERLFLGLAPALVIGAFGPSPAFDILIDMHIKANSVLGFSLVGYIPVASSEFKSDVGDGTASMTFLGADARLTLHIKDGRWRLNLAPGFGVLLVKLEGQAASVDYEGHDEFAYSATPILRGGVSFLVADPLHIRLDAFAGFALKEIVAKMASESETTFGRPILAVNLGIDLRLW